MFTLWKYSNCIQYNNFFPYSLWATNTQQSFRCFRWFLFVFSFPAKDPSFYLFLSRPSTEILSSFWGGPFASTTRILKSTVLQTSFVIIFVLCTCWVQERCDFYLSWRLRISFASFSVPILWIWLKKVSLSCWHCFIFIFIMLLLTFLELLVWPQIEYESIFGIRL